MDCLINEFTPDGAWIVGSIAAACVVCLLLAYQIRSRAETMLVQLTERVTKIRLKGPNPKKCTKIREQYQKVECERRQSEITIRWVAWLFLLFGFVAPLLLLLLIISLDSFVFAPGHRIFQAEAGQSVPTDLLQHVLFVVDEAGHVLTDAISDSFHWSITGLKRNEGNLTFSLYLALLFRLVCGGFAVSALTLIWRASVSLRPKNIGYLEMLKCRAELVGDCDLTEGMNCKITTKSTLARLREFLYPGAKRNA